jgi:hypothetical protein
VAGSWGKPSQDALRRFNALSKFDLALDDERATLDALKDWKGAHCTIEAVATPDAKTPKAVAPAIKKFKKAVKPVPDRPKASARAAAPRPKAHSSNSGQDQGGGEAQRAFPSTNWLGGTS